jgi:signal transduction histidine kinase
MVVTDCHYLSEQIHLDAGAVHGISDTVLINRLNSLNLNFQEFKSFVPVYLLLDKREHRTEIIFVSLLNALIIVLAGYAILRLTNQLAEAERKLVVSTIEVENRERERIAADLHDGLGALLSGLMIHLQVLGKEAGEKEELKKKLKHLGDLASGALTSLEETINNLNPSMLSRHGLVDSLQRLVVRINDLGKTQFSVESENMPETLDQGTGLLLYRICSELINNTLKHSGAGKASLRFAVVKKNLRVRYTDDGHGFEYDLEKIEERKSGINNIMQRVESMNGQCTISTAPGQGINVEITLPLVKT